MIIREAIFKMIPFWGEENIIGLENRPLHTLTHASRAIKPKLLRSAQINITCVFVC